MLLGIDYGEKYFGIAISDENEKFAIPINPIEKSKDIIEQIKKLVDEYKPNKIIMGLPISLKGEKGKLAQKIIEFSNILSSKLNIKVELYDERFSTKYSEKTLISIGMKREKRKKINNSISAAIILDDYIKRNEKN